MMKNVQPLVVVVLMIKNEAVSIEETLISYIQGGCNHFFVLDTGSTDHTVELVKNTFKQFKISGVVAQEPFVDFSYSRNRCLELAEQSFPEAIFFIMPDAEWYLKAIEQLMIFCEQERDKQTPIYAIKTKMGMIEFSTARLFRVKDRIRFKGVVHEAPTAICEVEVPDPVFFQVVNTHAGLEKSKKRWENDLLLLTKANLELPNDPRTIFYLAQTYECLGQLKEAFYYYQQRSNLSGWVEENFMTFFRLGCLAERLNPEMNEEDWQKAQAYYLQAFALRPQRIEPLVKIAEHYWPHSPATCYLFIKHAYAMPYPKKDQLFIEQNMYFFQRYEIMSRCAWYVDEFALGKEATLKALEIQPNMPHLIRNLALYEEKIGSMI